MGVSIVLGRMSCQGRKDHTKGRPLDLPWANSIDSDAVLGEFNPVLEGNIG
jgi:hypothetical protein